MNEQISQMMDGELDEDEVGRVLAALKSDQDLNDEWSVYHLIGDAMRDDGPVLTADFSSRFSERLAAEPIVFAPKVIPKKPAGFSRRYVAMSAAASVAAVAMVSWFALNGAQLGTVSPTGMQPIAAANDPALHQVSVSNGANIENVQDYLVVHREATGLHTANYTTAGQSKGH
ncbi:sigma-E factor negative regulatory protein RseA [Chitinivorax tropicus]|uniref:Sigma-E factor negative regulatory protein RseA n=1 Tax=Chitinivorax tropicus TaxID=714531 RepID=A0A840MSV5_9PROT|nr:sigma-E factor negative regulatory protein [Chitinivorax tropicus]MBB5020169.1 sigma-E factor negative regulatory protein RseA [Chitinivorax tropicus]